MVQSSPLSDDYALKYVNLVLTLSWEQHCWGGETFVFRVSEALPHPFVVCGASCGRRNTNTPQRRETDLTERGQSLHQFPTHGWQVMLAWWWSGTFDVPVITYGWQSSVKVGTINLSYNSKLV